MIHFLRDDKNNSVVDVETMPKDIHSVVCIDQYSVFLLANLDRAAEIVADFSHIQEIRGEFFESGWEGTTDDLAALRLRAASVKYGLDYVVD